VLTSFPRRLSWLLAGLFSYGIADSFMVVAAIGLSPWDVLAQGCARTTGIAYGWMTNLVGLAVLILWWPLRQRPGIGTVLNVALIGTCAQLGLWLVPQPHELFAQIALFTAGLLGLACATGIYLAPQLGPGPRDGLMTGMVRRTGWQVWAVRGGIELFVLVVGWLLGGQVGVGTLVEALLIGPLVHRTMPYFAARHARIAS
jgi:uncharacterized membrane protein YczE